MKRKTVLLMSVMSMLIASSSLAGLPLSSTISYIGNDSNTPVQSWTETFHFSPVSTHLAGNYLALEAGSNLRTTMKPSEPALPYDSTTITFPLGTVIQDIHIKTGPMTTTFLEQKIIPAPNPVLECENAQATERTMGSIYTNSAPFPATWGSVRTGAGLENQEHVMFLTFHAYPIRYLPTQNLIQTTQEITISVSFTPPPSPLFKTDEYDLLILCPDGWGDDLTILQEHKENHGIATVIIPLSEITNGIHFEPQGRDELEQIKYFIKNTVEEWGITYVLIVGGYDEFPMRKSWVYDENEIGWIDIPIPTDLYYADIFTANGSFSSWDTNNNSYFGEFNRPGDGNEDLYDIVDVYPDVYIGRLACTNEQSVATVSDKIITYENTVAGSRWFNRVLCIAGDTSPNDGYGDVDEGIIVTEDSLEYLSDFIPIRLYPGQFIPQLRLNTFTISVGLTIGTGLTHFAGHGNMIAWSTHPHGDSGTWIGQYGNSVITSLMNSDRLSVIRIGACLCGALDYQRESCFAWAFVEHEEGGAIASMASTRLSWGYIGEHVNQGLGGYHGILFFKGYEAGTTPSHMLVNAQNEYMNTIAMDFTANSIYDYKTVEEYILFGDPTLKIGGY